MRMIRTPDARGTRPPPSVLGVQFTYTYTMYGGTDVKLSVTICTLNEEEFIAMMIDSMIDYIHELIILDGCSTDKTIEIIEGYQAHYNDKIKLFFWKQNHPRSYVFDEKARRDWTFDKASGQWILFTAPDEIFPKKFWKNIDTLMEDPMVDFYTFPRINCWKHPDYWRVDSYPDTQLRMFRKGKGEFSEGPSHGFIVRTESGLHGGEAGRHTFLKDYPIFHFHWCSKSRPFDPMWCPPEAQIKKAPTLPKVVYESNWYQEGGFPEKWL